MGAATAKYERIAVATALTLALLVTYQIGRHPSQNASPETALSSIEARLGLHRFAYTDVVFSPLNLKYAWFVATPRTPFETVAGGLRLTLAPDGDGRTWGLAAALPPQALPLAVTVHVEFETPEAPLCLTIGLIDSAQGVGAASVLYGGGWCTSVSTSADVREGLMVQYLDATGTRLRHMADAGSATAARSATFSTTFDSRAGVIRARLAGRDVEASVPVTTWHAVDRVLIHVAPAKFMLRGRAAKTAVVRITQLQTSMYDRFFVKLPVAYYGGGVYGHPYGRFEHGSWLIAQDGDLALSREALPLPRGRPVHVVLFSSSVGEHMAVTPLAEAIVRERFTAFAAANGEATIDAFLPAAFVPDAVGEYAATATAMTLFDLVANGDAN